MLIFRKLAVCFSAIALVLSGCRAVFPKKIRGCWVTPGGQVAVFFDEHYIYYRDLLTTSMDIWGEYTVSDDGHLHLTTAIGTEHEASYSIDKDTLELTFNGQRQGFQKQSLEVCRQRP